jgi:hypothetical protein
MMTICGGKKMSKIDSTYDFAEGKHYFQFAFKNMISMFLARKNFASENKSVGYNPFFLDLDPFYIHNFRYDEDYYNIYNGIIVYYKAIIITPHHSR